MHDQIAAAWSYRNFIWTAIKGEFRARVARSRIGAIWFVLHPLAMALIYVLVLSEVLSAKLNGIEKPGGYAVFLVAGLAGWTIYAEILNRCLTVFIEYGNTLKKISFPRICLPIIVTGGALINQFILLVCIAIIVSFYGYLPSLNWIWLLPVVALTALLALGFGMMLGVMNIFARDIGQVMIVLMNVWFWLTPIVYSIEMVPETMRLILEWNPVTHLVGAYQSIILFNSMPDWGSLFYPAMVALILMSFSMFVFRRASPELVDAL